MNHILTNNYESIYVIKSVLETLLILSAVLGVIFVSGPVL